MYCFGADQAPTNEHLIHWHMNVLSGLSELRVE